MKYEPKVTIIIPVYNGSNFLAEAIEAALAQTYKNCEILVVNDGSKDDGASEKIALSYGDKITYYTKENGGVSTALNFALEKMHGEWFSWLSHDDLYYPQKIEKQVAFLNQLLENEPDIDLKKTVLHCATESIDKNGKTIKIPDYSDIEIKEKSLDVIVGNVYNYRLSGCSFLLPYAAYEEKGGFRVDIRTVSDVEYWYRLLFHGYQFYCMKNDILVKNRSHGKQVGKTKVSLFDKELAELHIAIADQLAGVHEYNNAKVFKKYYFGLIKRKISDAAKYTKVKYLKENVSPFEYFIIIPCIRVKWNLIGTVRNIARNIYRRINVK